MDSPAVPPPGPAVPPPGPAVPSPGPAATPAPRLRLAQRHQLQPFLESLDQRLDPHDHARTVWAFVETLDLRCLLEPIKAVEGHVGRNATDPRILLALWLLASIEGVGSARQLNRLCDNHRAFEWLRGNVSLNYHTLSDFRVQHVEQLNRLFAQAIAGLAHERLIDLNFVAQDGMRIRASAGSDSFRRAKTLAEHLTRAETHLTNLTAELTLNPAQLSARRRAAQHRAATERVERLNQAVAHVQELAASREARRPGDGPAARASTTDPESRRMKMPDGGTRPAFNAQLATTVTSGVIVGVDITNAGNDANELEPMMETIRATSGTQPDVALADGGFSTKANVEMAARRGIIVYMPLREEKKQVAAGHNPYAAKKGDSPAMAAFRARMGEAGSKALDQLRGQTAELTNARARRHDLYQVRVRGLRKVLAVLVLFALGENLLRAAALRAAAASAAAVVRAAGVCGEPG